MPYPIESKYPPQLQSCVTKLAHRLAREQGRVVASREDLSRAYAICMKGQQKAGQMRPGTIETTAKGKRRASEYDPRQLRDVGRTYERTLDRASGAIPKYISALPDRRTAPVDVAAAMTYLAGPSNSRQYKRVFQQVVDTLARKHGRDQDALEEALAAMALGGMGPEGSALVDGVRGLLNRYNEDARFLAVALEPLIDPWWNDALRDPAERLAFAAAILPRKTVAKLIGPRYKKYVAGRDDLPIDEWLAYHPEGDWQWPLSVYAEAQGIESMLSPDEIDRWNLEIDRVIPAISLIETSGPSGRVARASGGARSLDEVSDLARRAAYRDLRDELPARANWWLGEMSYQLGIVNARGMIDLSSEKARDFIKEYTRVYNRYSRGSGGVRSPMPQSFDAFDLFEDVEPAPTAPRDPMLDAFRSIRYGDVFRVGRVEYKAIGDARSNSPDSNQRIAIKNGTAGKKMYTIYYLGGGVANVREEFVGAHGMERREIGNGPFSLVAR